MSDEYTQQGRKAYTISKPRESWTDEEHQRFIEALKLYERDWKSIESYVGTKTVIQIRSHAQKYFQKMMKQGKTDQIPAPRPKRKSSRPYPKSRDSKRSKKNSNGNQARKSRESTEEKSQNYQTEHRMLLDNPAVLLDHDGGLPTSELPYGIPNAYGINQYSLQNGPFQPAMAPALQWTLWERQHLADLQHEHLQQAQLYLQQAIATNNFEEPLNGVKSGANFQKIYSFLGGLFDPSTSGHAKELAKMNSVDRDVIQLLMKNLASNLKSSLVADSEELQTSTSAPGEPRKVSLNDISGPVM